MFPRGTGSDSAAGQTISTVGGVDYEKPLWKFVTKLKKIENEEILSFSVTIVQ